MKNGPYLTSVPPREEVDRAWIECSLNSTIGLRKRQRDVPRITHLGDADENARNQDPGVARYHLLMNVA